MLVCCSRGQDAAGLDLHGRDSGARRAVAQLAISVIAHRPQGTIVLDEHRLIGTPKNIAHAPSHNEYGLVPIRGRAVA